MMLPLLLLIAADITGSWTGESICTGVRAACKDEHVIWTFGKPDAKDMVHASCDKVVNGERQNMGEGDMQLDRKKSMITWKIPLGVWELKINDDKIESVLRLNDGQIARHMNLKKDKP
jgi:hypothetical protein